MKTELKELISDKIINIIKSEGVDDLKDQRKILSYTWRLIHNKLKEQQVEERKEN